MGKKMSNFGNKKAALIKKGSKRSKQPKKAKR